MILFTCLPLSPLPSLTPCYISSVHLCVCVCVCAFVRVCTYAGVVCEEQYYDYIIIIFDVDCTFSLILSSMMCSPLLMRYGAIEITAVIVIIINAIELACFRNPPSSPWISWTCVRSEAQRRRRRQARLHGEVQIPFPRTHGDSTSWRMMKLSKVFRKCRFQIYFWIKAKACTLWF